MNKRVNIQLSTLLPVASSPGCVQLTGTVSTGRQNCGSAFIEEGTKTKKYKLNKNLSHSIQFTSLVLPQFRVYDNSSGRNETKTGKQVVGIRQLDVRYH